MIRAASPTRPGWWRGGSNIGSGTDDMGELDMARIWAKRDRWRRTPLHDRMPDQLRMQPMPERLRVLLFLNGVGLFIFALFTGWHWFVALLGEIVAWPLIPAIPAQCPAMPGRGAWSIWKRSPMACC